LNFVQLSILELQTRARQTEKQTDGQQQEGPVLMNVDLNDEIVEYSND